MRHRIYAAVAATLLCTAALCSCDRRAERADATNPEPTTSNAAVGSGPIEEQSAQSDDDCQLIEDGMGPDGRVAVAAEEVVDGLEVPWGLIFLGDGNLLVSERPGRLRLVLDGELVDEPIAHLEVSDEGEGGLLDIIAHPQFDANHQFYLYRTVDDGGQVVNRVELWQLSQDGEALGARQLEILVGDIPAGQFHNGGRMQIGPDEMLYVGTGDAQDPDAAQDPQSMAGKILRLTLDGQIPEDNPFDQSAAYLSGIRNTQGFDWQDSSTMVVTDHGPTGDLGRSGHDEISVAGAGANLGWPTIYGCENNPQMRAPSLVWQTAVPPGGAAIYTGDAIEEWNGSLLVGTLGTRHLHRVVFEEGSRHVAHHEVYFGRDDADSLGRLRDVSMGPDGHLYVTTSNCDGRGTCPPEGDKILRIVPR